MSEPSTGTVDAAGTFSPDDYYNRSITPLNPYISHTEWGLVMIGDNPVPGIVTAIEGASKPEEWSVQKGTSASNATTVWKGTKLAEAIKITTNLFDVLQVDAYYVLRDQLRPKLGTLPPSWIVINAHINWVGITRVAVVDITPPKWMGTSNSWEGTVTLIEYNPSKPAKAGPAGAAKAGNGGGQGTANNSPPSANQQAADEFKQAVAAAKAA